jgi:hypothetical protein
LGIWYCSREDVKAALDAKATARSDAQVDRAVESASRAVEGCLHRRFYPEIATRYFDWPSPQPSRSWRLWLDDNEIISATALISGGTTIAPADYFLRRSDNRDEPPYTHVEIDLSGAAAFSSGSTTQRAIALTGLYGYSNDTIPAGALAEALDDSETGVDVTDSAAIGVGHLILVGSERMQVTGKTMADTGVNIDAADSLAASAADVSITMSTTTGAPVVGETILIGSERMLVVDVAGSVLTVRRAWDGTVLAAHSANADIYAPRTLTVARGVLGTTAAAHSSTDAISRQVFPGPVRDYVIAVAIDQLLQETSGYAREVGSGDNLREASGRGLRVAEQRAVALYGRKARVRAV